MTGRKGGTPPVTRRTALGVGIGAGLLAAPAVLRAQGTWPNKTITLFVGYPPGGQTDFAARVLQQGLSTALGQTVVIENRGGAGGNLATDVVLRAPADGYRLLAGNASITINPHTMQGTVPDPLQLTPIGLMLQSSLVLCVHPSVPAKNAQEYADWARQHEAKDATNYGSSGPGSMTHVAFELFRERIGKPNLVHIPYRGSGPAMQDFLAGRFSAMFDAASVLAPYIKAGQLRPILSTGEQRIPAFPDIPTAAEQGIKEFTFITFIGLYGPPKLPPEIVQKANAALNTAMQDPNVRTRFTERGDDPGGGTAEDLAKLTKEHYALWGEVAKASNIRADQ